MDKKEVVRKNRPHKKATTIINLIQANLPCTVLVQAIVH